MIAAIPINSPISCFFFNFSLNINTETSKLANKGTPFAIGKNKAVSITPDKYKFKTLFPAAPIPQISSVIK